jgi:hypothetical protein
MINTNEIPDLDINIEWNPPEGVKALGIIFYADSLLTTNINWKIALDKVTSKMETLQYRELSLRGKIYILNSLILSKVVYLATVIKMPQWAWCDKDGNGLKRMIFQFLWSNANPEPIQRQILFLPRDKGGLGLLDLVQQGQALRIKYIFQITNNLINKPWIYLARYWLRSELYRYKPEWAFLNHNINNIPRYIPGANNITPYHYKRLLQDFVENKDNIIEKKATTTKEIYRAIRITTDSRVDVFVQHTWENSPILMMNGGITWESLWLNMYSSYNVGKIRDILYKLVHNCLPTKVRIKKTKDKQSRGGRFNTKCSQCTKVDENTLHIFSRCKHATNVWQMYKPIYTKLLPNQPYIYEQNALTINLQNITNPKIRKLLLTLTEIILQELWNTRNLCYKEQIQPCKNTSKNRINREMTEIINAHYKYHRLNNTLQTFRQKFTIEGALCSLNYRDKLNLHLPP